MAVTPWLGNYPWSDPIFQNFQVQQYLTISGVNPAQTYDLESPTVHNGVVDHAAIEAKVKLQAEADAAEAEKAQAKTTSTRKAGK
jgi:hypothetical protein